VCPSCGAGGDSYSGDERFCPRCGMPLVIAGAEAPPLSEARERARKILPRYSQGPLVRVATARHQAEAEMLEGLLLEEGIPSLIRRSGGFDVPDFLASGPRDILVPESGSELARDILGTDPASVPQRRTGEGTPVWVQALAVAIAVGILALIAAGVFVAVF
jgi:hypothetical protein